MIGGFLRGFAAAFVLSVLVFTALGFATRAVLFQPPPDRYYTRGFSFEYPAGWRCFEGQQEVVCDPPTEVDDAILIIATKTVDPSDTLANYRERLGQPMGLETDEAGQPIAKVLHTGDIMLGGQLWVEGTQEASEVPGYDTRYLATIAGPTAVLLTFSCHRRQCPALQPQIERVAASLQVLGSTIGDS